MLVRMLGPFAVDGDDGPVVVAGASQRIVLALLALHAGRPVGVTAIAGALWPDDPPPSARNSLQSHVARLRAALKQPGLITLGPAGYCLHGTDTDVRTFERLLRDGSVDEAIALWRGAPLPEFDREPFRGHAQRLTARYRDALLTVEPGERLRAEAAADPCWEGGAVALARMQASAGEALETLRRHADAVVERLGLDPSERVRALQTSLARGPVREKGLLGRDEEQRRLTELLREPGLVTVVGPGGVGKTRLVRETVRAGAWIDATDGDFLAAVLVGVGARAGPLDDPYALIGRHARELDVVVLDNCEHVVELAARVVEAMPGARIVVTSQERLRVEGERVLELGPLDEGAAARLFRERAGVDAEPAAVGEIVRRLDRLPLAIELAATQAAALGVGELRDRLDDRLDLLVRGRRTGAARHRTLRAVVEWSAGLLDAREREVLGALSVFAGGFRVGPAEAVAAGPTVAATLAALVDKSLVARDGHGRFRLLETIRTYAAQQLAGDREALWRRHADAMLDAVRRLDREFRGPGQAEAVRELDALLPDLRLAVARHCHVEELAAALYRYGYRCQQYEVLAWGRTATTNPDALAAAATHAWGRGDLDEARALAAKATRPSSAVHEVLGDVALVSCDPGTALAHYRAMDDEPVHRVAGLVGEALVLAWSGHAAEGIAAAESAVDLADASGNPSARAEARYGLGETLGDIFPVRALALLTEAAELAASVDDRLFRGAAESAAVAIRSRHGDPAVALAAFRDVLALWRRVGNDTLRAAALRNLVVLLVRAGADETAVLVDAALPPADVYPAERARLDRARAAAAERLGADRVAALRRRGARLSAAQVHDEASRAIHAALARRGG
ncbi:winged helix-turn-helix domain-containing protein [Actinoplanes bogorensis]|uniref:Winged helix-turn-helix domain-containing protein n=1 Tax=Paractinoplanes bogorensis TaxID=1610840 RepID=A0ABS5YHB2_9ACTN|nr:winged helix-turn-helix domain-containing protein [Actinoplanes bogorensis]MBU2662785.1 winged helix-turn-helix domain-containing protein [Actinoplanes bogorensis]